MDYLKQYRQLDDAGFGVVLTHSREPFQVSDALRRYAFSEKLPYRSWDVVNGWTTELPPGESGEVHLPSSDKMTDPVAAMQEMLAEKVEEVEGKPTVLLKYPDGINAMIYPHFFFDRSHNYEKVPEFIALLKQAVHLLPSVDRKRLVLIVPDGVNLPSELVDEVQILDYSVPDAKELRSIFESVLSDQKVDNPYTKAEVSLLVSTALGMTRLDFEQSLSLSMIRNTDFPKTPIEKFLREIQKSKAESVKRTAVLSVEDTTSASQLGGFGNFKPWLRTRRSWFHPNAKKLAGVEPPKGVLIIGVQGTGKSLCAKTVGYELNLMLIKLDIGSVFDQYLGQSEQRMATALAYLEAIAPCVVWVDEIDKAGLGVSNDGNSAAQRVLGKMLNFMQETKARIFWVFTANRVQLANGSQVIPPELTRKGRVSEIFGVGLPNPQERLEVLRIHLAKRGYDADAVTDLELAVKASDRYVPAELEEAVNAAAGIAFEKTGCTRRGNVTGKLIASVLTKMKPMSVSHRGDVEAIEKWCASNAVPVSLEKAEEEGNAIKPVVKGVKTASVSPGKKRMIRKRR